MSKSSAKVSKQSATAQVKKAPASAKIIKTASTVGVQASYPPERSDWGHMDKSAALGPFNSTPQVRSSPASDLLTSFGGDRIMQLDELHSISTALLASLHYKSSLVGYSAQEEVG